MQEVPLKTNEAKTGSELKISKSFILIFEYLNFLNILYCKFSIIKD